MTTVIAYLACRLRGHKPSWRLAAAKGIHGQPVCWVCGRPCAPDNEPPASTPRHAA